jgi:hypothetical protein
VITAGKAGNLPISRGFSGVSTATTQGSKDAVKQHTDRLAGKAVVDITNPVDTETCDRLAICAWELVP